MPQSHLHWIQISDSHLSTTEAESHQRLLALVNHIKQLHADAVPIDFVLHNGDLCDSADAVQATSEVTQQGVVLLQQLPVPVFIVNGNHDRQAFIQQALGVNSEEAVNAATAICSGVSVRCFKNDILLFINANPENGEHDLNGIVSKPQLLEIDRYLKAVEQRVSVFLHYVPFTVFDDWQQSLVGGEQLHSCLRQHHTKIAGVFCGHMHRSFQQVRDGILYVVAPSSARHFDHWPHQQQVQFTKDAIVGFNYVAYTEYGTQVQQHAFVYLSVEDEIGCGCFVI